MPTYFAGGTFEEQEKQMAPINQLLRSGQYRDVPGNVIQDFFSGSKSLEETVSRIKGTPLFNPSIGPQVDVGQGMQKPGFFGLNAPGQGFFTPEILQNAVTSLRQRAAGLASYVPKAGAPSTGALSVPQELSPESQRDTNILDNILSGLSIPSSVPGQRGTDILSSLLGNLKTALGTGTGMTGAPAIPSLLDTYKSFRASEGLSNAELEFESARSEMRDLENKVILESDKIKSQPGVTTAFIGRKLVKLDADTANALRETRMKVQDAQDRLISKQKTIETLMQFTQQDYQNASERYNNEYNRNFQLMSLLIQQQDKRQNDAVAKLKIIYDAMAAGNIDIDKISAHHQSVINDLELIAYGTTGIFRMMEPGDQEIDTFTDSNNNRVIVMWNPLTKSTKNIIVGKVAPTAKAGQPQISTVSGSTGGINNQTFYNALNQANIGSSNSARADNQDNLSQLLSAGDYKQAKEYIVRVATSNAGIELQTKAVGRLEALEALKDIKGALQEYVALTGDTNIIRGTAEQAANKMGLTTDPKLQFIHNQIRQAFINYRRSMTGVAFSPEESAQYEAIFPKVVNVEGMNVPIIDSLLLTMNRNQKIFLSYLVGPSNYEQLFETDIPQSGGQSGNIEQSIGDDLNLRIDDWLKNQGF